MFAKLKDLDKRLADLEEEHKKLGILLTQKKRLLETFKKEKESALSKYTFSVEYTNEMLDIFTQGFDKSLEKVKEIQPDLPVEMILPPPRALEFKAMLKSKTSSSLQSAMIPPRNHA